ncbi:MAG: hypothetical protein JW803_06040 [Endomicrobiales bacterium]|nr:hypothetical protein [Endomicrobiales bacterium]
MQTRKFILFTLSVILFALIAGYAGERMLKYNPEILIEENEDCFAYRIVSKLFFIGKKESFVKNYQMSYECIRQGSEHFYVKVMIPIEGFKSGTDAMDKNAQRLLRMDQNPDLVFMSETLSIEQAKGLLENKQGAVRGSLQVGLQTYPIEINYKIKDNRLYGDILTTFSYFDIEPPTFGPAGMLARTKDYLELYYLVNLEKMEIFGINCKNE